MIRNVAYLLLILCSIVIHSCRTTDRKKISFYHWKLQVDEPTSNEFLQKYSPNHIYLHIMDVDFDFNQKNAIPKSSLHIEKEDALLTQQIIPVIFIQNRVMTECDTTQLYDLAKKIIDSKNDFINYHSIKNESHELQIDCDWLQSHKEKYFYFLRKLKEIEPELQLSVTLRLYPFKYRKTMGVPPVDYVVLMCYNIDDIKKLETKQSILQPNVLEQYLTNTEYPLKLKIALPIFGWWVWFHQGEYKNILYLPETFKNSENLRYHSEFLYQIQKDTSLHGNFIRNQDLLRNEFPTHEDLIKSINILKSKLNFEEVIFYHWDKTALEHYEKTILQ